LSYPARQTNGGDNSTEMEPGHGSPGHWVTGSAILTGSGRVTGQCISVSDRCFTRFWVLTCAFIVSLFLKS